MRDIEFIANYIAKIAQNEDFSAFRPHRTKKTKQNKTLSYTSSLFVPFLQHFLCYCKEKSDSVFAYTSHCHSPRLLSFIRAGWAAAVVLSVIRARGSLAVVKGPSRFAASCRRLSSTRSRAPPVESQGPDGVRSSIEAQQISLNNGSPPAVSTSVLRLVPSRHVSLRLSADWSCVVFCTRVSCFRFVLLKARKEGLFCLLYICYFGAVVVCDGRQAGRNYLVIDLFVVCSTGRWDTRLEEMNYFAL